MTLDYHGIGRRPDSRFTVTCERCATEYHGLTEGDTGASYYLPGDDENNGPQERPCHFCGAKTGLCQQCIDAMAVPLCRKCDAEEFATSEVAKILGLSVRQAQHLGLQMGKTIEPRYRQYIWTMAEIKEAQRRNTKRGPKSSLSKSAN